VAIAGAVVNPRSVLLRNFVLKGQVSASNPLLHIHANRYVQCPAKICFIRKLRYPWLRRDKRCQLKNNIPVGMPTLIYLETLQKNIEFCHSINLDLLKMNMNLPYLQIEELKKIHLPKELQFSIHLPEDLNVWDFNPKVRKAYIETLTETLEYAEKQNIQIPNLDKPEPKRFKKNTCVFLNKTLYFLIEYYIGGIDYETLN